MAITFIHTADWQLGKPYARVTDPAKRARLQNERIECLKRIGEAVRVHQASFVVVAGDLFDSPSPLNSTVAAACEAIGAMGVPVWIIPGNHDHGGPGSLWEQPFFLRQREQLAPNLHILLDSAPAVLPGAVIFPAPLLRQQDTSDPTAWLRAGIADFEIPEGLPRIVLAHGSVQGFDSATDEDDESAPGSNLIDLQRLPPGSFDYIALGDWHGTKQVSENAWYSGTPETDRFPKGINNDPGNLLVVTATRGAPPSVVKLRTGGLHWHEFSFFFAEDESVASFRQQLDSRIGQWGQESLLKLSLEGSLGIEASRALAEHLESLEARLLRLKLDDRVTIAPTADEIANLATRPGDPLIASVAAQLIEMQEGTESDIALLALRELHAALC